MDDKQYFAIYGVLKAVHTGEIEPDIAADVIVSGLSHAEGGAVGEITIDKHGDAHFRASQGYLDLDQGTYDLYTHPAPPVAVPEGWRHALEEALAMMTSQSMTLERQADAVTGIRDLLAAAPTAPAGEPDDSDICERVELPHVLAWADGVRGDMWTEYADRITDEEARVAQAVWAAHTGGQPVSDPDGLPDRVLMPKALAADLATKTALTGKFFVDAGVRCAQCGNPDFSLGLGECAACQHNKYESARLGVPWTTIKHTYAAAVDLLSAPAPDEREIAARALDDFKSDVAKWVSLLSDSDPETRVLRKVNGWLHSRAKRLRAGKEDRT